jgi:hypothetical protein
MFLGGVQVRLPQGKLVKLEEPDGWPSSQEPTKPAQRFGLGVKKTAPSFSSLSPAIDC